MQNKTNSAAHTVRVFRVAEESLFLKFKRTHGTLALAQAHAAELKRGTFYSITRDADGLEVSGIVRK